jgi:hypothetical protein
MPPGCHTSVPRFDVSALAGAMADYSQDSVRRSEEGHRGFDFAEGFNQANRSTYLSLVEKCLAQR